MNSLSIMIPLQFVYVTCKGKTEHYDNWFRFYVKSNIEKWIHKIKIVLKNFIHGKNSKEWLIYSPLTLHTYKNKVKWKRDGVGAPTEIVEQRGWDEDGAGSCGQ